MELGTKGAWGRVGPPGPSLWAKRSPSWLPPPSETGGPAPNPNGPSPVKGAWSAGGGGSLRRTKGARDLNPNTPAKP